MFLTLQGYSVCGGIGIINTNIHLILSEYFISNECPEENVKPVAIIRGHWFIDFDCFIPFDNE